MRPLVTTFALGLTLLANYSFALNCPSLDVVKNTQLNQVLEVCDDDAGQQCEGFVAISFSTIDNNTWMIGDGVFENALTALAEGQVLLQQATSPRIEKEDGDTICIYKEDYANNKFIVAIQSSDFFGFNRSNLMKSFFVK